MAVAILTSVFVETLSALNSLGNSNVCFGQKQTFAVQKGMSALPLKADINPLLPALCQ